jgi:hypothetical protein
MARLCLAVSISRAFSSEVGAGSRQENASNKTLEARAFVIGTFRRRSPACGVLSWAKSNIIRRTLALYCRSQ